MEARAVGLVGVLAIVSADHARAGRRVACSVERSALLVADELFRAVVIVRRPETAHGEGRQIARVMMVDLLACGGGRLAKVSVACVKGR